MSELTELLGKVKLEHLMGFMIYGADVERGAFKNYEQEIENSYNEIFAKLEAMYSEIDRKDDKLFDVVSDFAMLHDDIYFEAGVLIRFQLYKNLEQGYQEHKNGKPITEHTFQATLSWIENAINKDRQKRAEKEKTEYELIPHFYPHALRHTFATRRFEAGIDAKVVQGFLGHYSISITLDLYTHVTDDKAKSRASFVRNAKNRPSDGFS